MTTETWNNLLPTKCDWCPIACGANRAAGKSGFCGADDTCLVARSALHFWEEPPISGIAGGPKRGQGPGSGTIFFSNCSVACAYCQNHKISGVDVSKKLGKPASPSTLVKMMVSLQEQGAMNINFVTGTHYRSHIITAVRQAREAGLTIPIVWNSSGYETVATVSALAGTVDIWMPDFKYADAELAAQMSASPKLANYPEAAIEAIATMLDFCPEAHFDTFKNNLRMTRGVLVRHMILPGHLQNSKDALSALFAEFGNDIKYSIMNQYTPVILPESPVAKNHPELLQTVSAEDYEEILDFADNLGIKDYYWQQGSASSESFIPDFSACYSCQKSD